MTPIPDDQRLKAAFAVVRAIHDSVALAEKYPSGTSFTPVGIEDGDMYVAVRLPDRRTNVEMERVGLE